jgi:adenylate cyclase
MYFIENQILICSQHFNMEKYIKYLLLVLFAIGTVPTYAQLQGQAKIDSLLSELPQQKEDSNKVKLLDLLSNIYSTISPDRGLKYGQQAMALATKLDWKFGIALTCSSLGLNFQNQSDYPKALYFFFKYLQLSEEIGYREGIAGAIGNIGINYYNLKNYPKALEYFSSSLKLNEELGDKNGIAAATCNIGNIYEAQKNYQKALEYAYKALALTKELGNRPYVAINTLNIGILYKEQNNYIMAVEYLQHAVKLFEELQYKIGIANSLSNIGAVYLAKIEDTAAKVGIFTGATELPDIKYQPTASMPEGRSALLAAAIDYQLRALLISKEIKALEVMQSSYSDLSVAYKLKGDYKKALEASDNFHAIKDSVFSQENKEEILKMGMKNDYDRQRLTDSLKTAEKQKIATINLKKQKNYTYLGVAGILLLAGFSFFIVKERGKSETARKQSDELLLNILPEEVASELKTTGTTTARHYDNVTVLFTDFVNFTQASENMGAQNLIDELHACFRTFDEIMEKYNIEKIKTIGDAYLAVAGLPTADPKHAENVIKAAKEITAFMENRLGKLGTERTFQIRVGIHSGSVVAGIVGVKKFAYDIWGDTVNTAARMEQNSEAGKINISQTTYDLIKDKFACEHRGEMEVKGKGILRMYYVS